MNDLEQTLVNLDFNINDCNIRDNEVYAKYLEVKRIRELAQKRLESHNEKINVITAELDDLKVKNMSLIMVPSIGGVFVSLGLLFGVPLTLGIGIFGLGAISGFKITSDMVKYKSLNNHVEVLLNKLFPSIAKKNFELKKIYKAKNKCAESLNSLTLEEESLLEEHEELVDGIEKLKEIKDSVLDLHLSKLSREYLPCYTKLEDIINKTVNDPSQFYGDVCRELTDEERRDIILDIGGKSCNNCQNYSCCETKKETDKITDCKSWYNEEEIGMSKVLRR